MLYVFDRKQSMECTHYKINVSIIYFVLKATEFRLVQYTLEVCLAATPPMRMSIYCGHSSKM